MRRPRVGVPVAIAAGVLAWSAALQAQSSDIVVPPPNVVLANPNSLPPGPIGSLEGGAFVARADDGSSNWYNTAGLARAEVSSASATAGTYEISDVNPTAFQDSSGGDVTNVPALVGIVVKKAFGHDARWSAGFGAVRMNSWQQNLAAQLVVATGANSERFALTAASSFTREQLSLGAAYQEKDSPWRFGFGIAGEYSGVYKLQTLSDVTTSPTGVRSSLASSRYQGSELNARALLGVQYDASKEWKLGLTVRSPGIGVFPSGEGAIDGVVSPGSPSLTAYFFDTNLTFKYKVPLDTALGVAWVGDNAQFEVDVQYQSGWSPYLVFSSQQPVTLVTDAGNGTPPTTTTVPWEGLTTDPRGTVNVALGGHFDLDAKKIWKLHFGFTTNFSPVEANDQVFTDIDLYSGTVGFSGQASHIQASIGVRYEWGTSGNLSRDPNGVTTVAKIRNIGVVYSLGYLF